MHRTVIMGIVNVSPDSFSGDGLVAIDDAVAKARVLVEQGADIIDVGGESTRPGYGAVTLDEELRRVVPAVEAIAASVGVPVSVDTSKAAVARRALEAGASIVNDVSALSDPRMTICVAGAGAQLVLVDNQPLIAGERAVTTVLRRLESGVQAAIQAGVKRSRIIVDPGFGFGKSWLDNFALMRDLQVLTALSLPILVGPSRKGMIGRVLGVQPDDRLEGTIALVTLCVAAGANIVRVHDVGPVARAVRVIDALTHPAG